MNRNWNKRSYNPMMVRNLIYYIDGDEKKGVAEQHRIDLQEDQLAQLEEEIEEAHVGVCGYLNCRLIWNI